VQAEAGNIIAKEDSYKKIKGGAKHPAREGEEGKLNRETIGGDPPGERTFPKGKEKQSRRPPIVGKIKKKKVKSKKKVGAPDSTTRFKKSGGVLGRHQPFIQ